MLLNAKFGCACSLFILSSVYGEYNKVEWVNSLIRYTKKDLKVFQKVLVIDDDVQSQDRRISSILGRLQQEFLSQVITVRNPTTSEASIKAKYLLHRSLQGKSLFIMIKTLNSSLLRSQTNDTTDFLKQLFKGKIQPKCLLIALPKKGNLSYKKFLHYLWSNNFLEFTVLEITERSEENNAFHLNRRRNIATMNYYNPFTGTYTSRHYRTGMDLFPNKLQDLKGFAMKVGSFHLPPYVHVKRNALGDPVNISGPDALVAKILSEKMNFKLSEVPSQEESFGDVRCENSDNTAGLWNLLLHNKLRFLTNQRGYAGVCSENTSIFTKSTGTISICALVPIMTSVGYFRSPSMNWLFLVLLLLIIWISAVLLKFEDVVWSWLEIIRVMLGFGVPAEPKGLSERIMFISILVAFTIFSTNIFAMLTDTKLVTKPMMKIESLEELNRSDLIPMMLGNFVVGLKAMNDSVNQALANKASIVLKLDECYDMLVQHKNVTCILRESTALIAMQERKDAHGDVFMEIVKERLLMLQKVMYLEPNSPFVVEINVIISRLIQSGLITHWENKFMPHSKRSNQWEIVEELDQVRSGVLTPLVLILAFGCALAIAVFIYELSSKYIENRIHFCLLFFSQ